MRIYLKAKNKTPTTGKANQVYDIVDRLKTKSILIHQNIAHQITPTRICCGYQYMSRLYLSASHFYICILKCERGSSLNI